MRKLSLLCILLCTALCVDNGIDVSVWQGGSINWSKVKGSGHSFAIVRAGYSTSKDKYFDVNYSNGHKAGMNLGAYWYSYANTGEDGKKEANAMLSVLSGKKLEYPVYIDIEESSIFKKGIASSLAKHFCSVMEQHKWYCGIYSSLSALNSYFDHESKTKYTIWVAQWSSSCSYKGKYGLWQYSSKGSVPGISGNVDMDKGYIDFPKIMKEKHLNGY